MSIWSSTRRAPRADQGTKDDIADDPCYSHGSMFSNAEDTQYATTIRFELHGVLP